MLVLVVNNQRKGKEQSQLMNQTDAIFFFQLWRDARLFAYRVSIYTPRSKKKAKKKIEFSQTPEIKVVNQAVV